MPKSYGVSGHRKPTVGSRMARCSKSCLRTLYKRVPVTHWLPRYPLRDIFPDLIAGFTVGLTLIPQSMGYATLAGLEPQYGLYSAFLGSFIYIVFGSVKEVNMGPAALLALLTYNYTHHLGPQFAVLLCFVAGCMELLFGILHLGFLVDFISAPVVAGFTSAAAFMVASAQVKGLLGLKFDAESFAHIWTEVYNHIHETKLWDAVLGGCCCVFLLSLKFFKDHFKIGDGRKPLNCCQTFISKFVWFFCTARNALIVLVSMGIAYYFHVYHDGFVPFMLTGTVQAGLPPFQIPALTAEVNNRTLNILEMVGELKSGVIVVPVVAIIANVAIGKAFASGKMLDATQEMVALGLCNIAGSFVSSMPAMGSFSRSAVSNASGVRSPLAGLYTGAMVILSLTLLTPYFYFIPRATLAAVIMCAVIFMVEVDKIGPMWRTNKKDLLSFAVAFVACLALGMEMGLVIGAAVDIAFLLFTNARPKVKIDTISSACGPEYILATPTQGLLFPAADYVRTQIQSALEDMESNERMTHLPVVIDCRNIQKLDFTAAQGLESIVRDFNKQERLIIFCGMKSRVLSIMSGVSKEKFHHASSENELSSLLRGTFKSHRETALLLGR
ncbi:sodium-independent sulfate anion transporter-like isoform X2 [Neocloeon triangulifer]|nr:sodium-independent sulfate anion transporter-like isoform X2 [Neocloeon triangulifer]